MGIAETNQLMPSRMEKKAMNLYLRSAFAVSGCGVSMPTCDCPFVFLVVDVGSVHIDYAQIVMIIPPLRITQATINMVALVDVHASTIVPSKEKK